MYGYDNYRKVKEEIEKRRLTAEGEADRRNLELRAISEDVRAIDAQLVRTGLELFKAACDGADITPIREKNLALNKTRRDILKALGYPEDYTEPHYTCKKCKDLGFIGASMCSCLREMLIKENIKSSGIGRLIDKQSFENFSLNFYDGEARELMEKNFLFAKDFAENFSKDGQSLLLIGPTGTGKTHISTAIAKALIEKGVEVIYDSAQNIVSAFEKDKFRSGYGPYEPEGDKYLECELLILDDLGTEFASSFTVSCLYNLLNTRINKGLPTVISTNLSPAELSEKYEDRIYSRIVGAGTRILLFKGKDKRLS